MSVFPYFGYELDTRKRQETKLADKCDNMFGWFDGDD